MEQKKILWAVAAVGAFLLVVIGAAMIIYNPFSRSKSSITSTYPIEKSNSNDNGWIKPSITTENSQVLPPPSIEQMPVELKKADEVYVISDNTTVYDFPKTSNNESTTIDLNNSVEKEPKTENVPQNINITVNLPQNLTPAATTQQIQTKEVAAQKVESVKTVEPAVETKTVVSTKTTPTQAKTTSTPKETTVKTVTKFWVQIASYSNKKGAESARSVLSENKIPSDIFTYKDNNDKLFYRVRVGPYTTKSEASYWQSKILQIQEFEKAESYITSTQSEN